MDFDVHHYYCGGVVIISTTASIAKQILTTRGVNSRVLVPGFRQTRMTAGHVGLFDFDGVSKQFVLDETLHLEGINILWASSNTGFHLWNLSIRSAEEIAILGLKIGSDCKHVQHGYRQGKWVLRTAPKFREGNKQYKPAPKLLHTWCNPSLRFQSEPHMKLFIALTGKTSIHKTSYEFQGLSAELEQYRTVTDRMKQELSK